MSYEKTLRSRETLRRIRPRIDTPIVTPISGPETPVYRDVNLYNEDGDQSTLSGQLYQRITKIRSRYFILLILDEGSH